LTVQRKQTHFQIKTTQKRRNRGHNKFRTPIYFQRSFDKIPGEKEREENVYVRMPELNATCDIVSLLFCTFFL